MKRFLVLLLSTFLIGVTTAMSKERRGNGKVFLGSKALSMPTMPNVDYAFRGYNLLLGNPLSTGYEADPGFSSAIFKPVYSGYVTGDLKYQIPDGVYAYRKPICNIDFLSRSYGNEKSYQDEIKVNVDVDFGGWGAAFTANPEYKKQTESMIRAENHFLKTEALCGVYEIVLDIYNPPNITEGFANAVRTLEDGDYQSYLKFVQVYGTHFLTTNHMGAKYTEQMEISKNSKDLLEREGVDVDVAASYSTMWHLDIDLDTAYHKEIAEKFDNKVTKKSIITYGSRPPADGNSMTWTNSVFEEPLPINYGLLRVQDLFNERIMGSLGINYEEIVEKLTNFLEGYCENEKATLGLKDCNGPNGGCSGGHTCHHNAQCIDIEYEQDGETITSYECSCKENYIGDGFQCSGWNIQNDLKHDLFVEEDRPGDWYDIAMCPVNTYAYAFSLKIEDNEPLIDDTALNGVKLYCKSFDGNSEGEITSGMGDFGSWKSVKACLNEQEFLEGFRFRSENDIFGDDTWGDDIDMSCSGGQIIEGGGLDWGSWSSWTYCPNNARICGLQTMIEEPQGWLDDTGLVNLKFKCCEI